MEIIFLGTSQAVPTAKRNHTAILLKYLDETLLFDCGEGTQRQFRIAKLNPCKLTRIFISHFHGDHILGIPGLLQTLALNGYNKTLHVYIPHGTRKYMDLIMAMFVFAGKLKYEIHEVEGIALETKNFIVKSLPLEHTTKCLGYEFIEKDKRKIDKSKLKKYKLSGPLVGELQRGNAIEFDRKKIKPEQVSYVEKGKKVSFIFDTRVCKNCLEIAKNADLLIAESTYCEDRNSHAKEYYHLTASQVAGIAKKAKAKKLIITHISQIYEKNPEVVLKEAKKVFKNTFLAYDFMKIKV